MAGDGSRCSAIGLPSHAVRDAPYTASVHAHSDRDALVVKASGHRIGHSRRALGEAELSGPGKRGDGDTFEATASHFCFWSVLERSDDSARAVARSRTSRSCCVRVARIGDVLHYRYD